MIEFKRVLNIGDELSRYLTERRRTIDPTGNDDEFDPETRVISQEKDGFILYTWEQVAPNSQTNKPVTHVGIFDPASKMHQVLWIYTQSEYIASCSINQEQTLLAFSTVTKETRSGGSRQPKEIYRAYIAEIKPQNRVFSLNLERHHFLKVQFLYSYQQGQHTHESHMLVFLYKESIGLYSIPLARAGDRGIIMSDQPKTQQLVKKFVWCQWDAQNQRLHYVHYRKASIRDLDELQPVLSSIQFQQQAQFDNILDVPLNFSFPYIKSSKRSVYQDVPLHIGIPEMSLNLEVLAHSNGSFCICYQPSFQTIDRPRVSPTEKNIQDDTVEMEYYVCIVHHIKTLNGCVSGIPRAVAKTASFYFSWYNDYLMITLPGYFVHLLNVGIEFEPCHHILLHEKTLQSKVKDKSFKPETSNQNSSVEEKIVPNEEETPAKDDADEPFIIDAFGTEAKSGHFITHLRLDQSASGRCMYDVMTDDIYRVMVNTDTMLDVFAQSHMAPARLALLHYAILHMRDLSLIQKMFEVISTDIASSEVPDIMAEFLVGTTYANMRRKVDRDVFRLLPFTVSDTFRGQFDKNSQGDRLARISYTPLHRLNISTRTAKERQRRITEDLWDTLRRRLRMMQLEQPPRFCHETVIKASKEIQSARDKGIPLPTWFQEKSFLSKISVKSKTVLSPTFMPRDHAPRSRTDSVLGAAPSFLQESGRDQNGSQHEKEFLTLTEELFTNHMVRFLKKDSKIKAQGVTSDYLSCQAQQSKQLCHLLWSLRRGRSSQECIALTEPVSDDEYELFQLFERFYGTIQEKAFPAPDGFTTVFISLGFRCLNFNLFMQYVDRGVLNVTGEFVTQLLEDLSDDGDNVSIKYQIISRLPQALGEECYRRWNHPMCTRYFINQQVSKVLIEGLSATGHDLQGSVKYHKLTSSGVTDNVSTSSNSDAQAFQPLTNFLLLLDKAEHMLPVSQASQRRPHRTIDNQTLEDFALYHTHTETCYDLGTVSF